MTEYDVLDLFSGLGGFSAAFEDSDRWSVTTVDFEEKFDPDIIADVFHLKPSDLVKDYDVVLASPPCTEFSMAASRYKKIVDGEPQTADAKDAVALVYHTIGLIEGLAPEYWFMENPQGYLRQIIGDPTGRVTYCQYGTSYMKPTDLWGDHPDGFDYRSCSYGDECHAQNTDWDHGGQGNARDEWTDDEGATVRTSEERAKVPYDLSRAIRDACEARLDGNGPQQMTFEGVE